AAMSIHCINMPPKIVPWTLVNPGNTSWTVSTRDERGVRLRRGSGVAALGIVKPVSPSGGAVKPPGLVGRARDRRSGATGASCIVERMIGRPCAARHLLSVVLLSAVTVGAAPSAHAKKMTLEQLLEMARGNPGLRANAAAIEASRAQVTEAKLNWLPQGDLLSILAPSPNLQCLDSNMQRDPNNCLQTSAPEAR